MEIFNSKTNKLEIFKPIVDNEIKMYVCGPTIYSDVHIGNTRPLIFFDIVAKYFKCQGYKVSYVSNITDIDDKIINKAIEHNVSESKIVESNLIEYKKVCSSLKVDSFYAQPRVTEYINEIIMYISKLMDLDFAYELDGDVYFKVDKLKEYGKISNVILDQQKVGARVAVDTNKKYEFDFVLWKKTLIGITWDSPFGPGRPGWHTECVVMINELLGDTIDIHGGGVDLKFPHHENENAQSMACGHDLANVWMHNGFININDEKMSKSIGNIINAKDLINELSANVVKLLMLQTSYRQPINIDDEFIKQTQTINSKFSNVFNKINSPYKCGKNDIISEINLFMESDFNVANIVSFMLSKCRENLTYDLEQAFLYTFDLLGLVYEKEELFDIPEEIIALINKRVQLKSEKNFEMADIIRQDIEKLGYEIKDTRDGVQCQKISMK